MSYGDLTGKGQSPMLPAKELEELRWYATRANHGRGRLSQISKQLLARGLLHLEHTSVYEWRLTITDKGRSLL